MTNDLQHAIVGSRARFVVALAILFMVSALAFAGWLRFCESMHWHTAGRLLGFGVLAAVFTAVYALRFRQLRMNPAWALTALLPVGNIAVPIFLIIKNAPPCADRPLTSSYS